jgi:hypothetical protein
MTNWQVCESLATMKTISDTAEYNDYLDILQPVSDWLNDVRLSDLVMDQVPVWMGPQTENFANAVMMGAQ